MATTTTKASVEVAKFLRDKAVNSAYIAIGRTTAWDSESTPPQPSKTTQVLDEVIGYKKVNKVYLVKRLGLGEVTNLETVEFDGSLWGIVPDNIAVEEGATYVYFEASIKPTDLPLGAYRQVGVHTGLVPNVGVNKDNLLPSEVADTGLLEFFENRPPQTRYENVRVTERFVVNCAVQ